MEVPALLLTDMVVHCCLCDGSLRRVKFVTSMSHCTWLTASVISGWTPALALPIHRLQPQHSFADLRPSF